MSGAVLKTVLVSLTFAVSASSCSLSQPIMVLPPGLQRDGQVLDVSGRTGGLVWNPQVRFGPFHTTEIHRGWRSDSFENWRLLEVHERWDASQPLSFVLEGPRAARWKASCLAASYRDHREKPNGFQWDENGLALSREVVRSVSAETYECALRSLTDNAAPLRILLSDAGLSGFNGVLIAADQRILARIRSTNEQTGKPYTYTVPAPVGFVLETDDGISIGIERAFRGKIILDGRLPFQQACGLAAVATALLVWEPLR